MSLSARIALIIGAALLLGAAALDWTFGVVFDRHFHDTEVSLAHEAGTALRRAVEDQAAELGRDGARIALHDGLHAAIQRRDLGVFAGALLAPEALAATGLDLVYITDLEGRVVFAHVAHPDRGVTSLRRFPREALNLTQIIGAEPLMPGRKTDRGVLATGLTVTEAGPLVIAARGLMPLTREEPRRGYVLLGRFLGEAMDAELEARLGRSLEVWPVGTLDAPAEVRAVEERVTSSPEPVLDFRSDEWLDVYTSLEDVHRRPEFIVRLGMRRDVAAAATLAGRSGLLMSLTLCCVLLMVLLACLRRMVLRPLGALTAAVVRAGEQEDYGVRVASGRGDEIGTLGTEFDGMLERLEEARAQVIESARSAGMSEIAQGILHSAGTVLNSVNTSVGVLRERVLDLPLGDLSQLVDVLERNAEDLPTFMREDPRGRHLVRYLRALEETLWAEHDAVREEVGTLEKGIERVCDLIKSQESNAGRATLMQRTEVRRILSDLENLVELNVGDAVTSLEFQVDDRELTLTTDRHVVGEILLHLVQNAWDAIQSFGPRPEGHSLSVRVSRELGRTIRFSVKDSGIGVDPSLATGIFEMGFTTRPGGSGIGLHAAANSAKLLGGRIEMTSEGIGQGATFSLVLPTVYVPESRAERGSAAAAA